MRRPARPGRLGALGVVVLLAVAVAAWLGWTGLQAQRHLEAARGDLSAARDALAARDVDAARAAIAAAAVDTRQARSATSGVVWRLATSVPGEADNTLLVVRGLAAAADDLAATVLPAALDGAERIDPARLRLPDGAVDLAVVRDATPPLSASAREGRTVRADVEDLPDAYLVAPVADALAELGSQVEELTGTLDGAATALEVAPALLGEDRPRRYLVLVQQTGESRGTGGLIGGYVELLAESGRITAVSQGSNTDLRSGEVPVPEGVSPEYEALYGPEGAFELWQNVNLSPDLPVVAEVVEARWQAQGGAPLDGVVALDGKALADVLAGSGPITLPGGRELAPEQVQDYLAVGQYEGVPLSPAGALTRKDQLSDAAALVAGRLTAGGGDTESLLRGLAEAVRSGHLRMSSDDPALEGALSGSGVAGGLPTGGGPLLYPVVFNSTGGKLDHFLDRSVRWTAGACDGATRRSRAEVVLTNTAPEGLPPYLTIRVSGGVLGSSLTNALTVQVYATPGAELVSATLDGEDLTASGDGPPRLLSAEEAGIPLWYLALDLPPGQPRRLVLELDEPVVEGDPLLLEQPLSRPLERSVDVPACG